MRLKILLIWVLFCCPFFTYASEDALKYIKGEQTEESKYTFLGKKLGEKDLLQLQTKLSANVTEENQKAVLRDQLALDFHKISLREKELLEKLKKLWQVHASKKVIDSYIEKEVVFLSEYNFPLSVEEIEAFKLDDKFGKVITSNFEHLNTILPQYEELVVFLKNNFSSQDYSIDALDDLFSYTYSWVYKINNSVESNGYKYSIGPFNTGNVLVSVAVLIIIGILLRISIFHFLKLILRFSLKTGGNRLEKLVHSIDTPLLTFILLVSTWLSVKVISYPGNYEWLNQTLFASSMLLLFWFIWRLLSNYQEVILENTANISKKGVKYNKDITVFIIRSLKTVVFFGAITYAILIIFPDISSKVGAGAGILGIIVAFFVKEYNSGLFSTVKLVFNSNMKSSDWIEVYGYSAVVSEIGVHYSTLRGFDNQEISIPNSELAKQHLINWSRRKYGRPIKVDNFKFSLQSDIHNVKKFVDSLKEYLQNNSEVAKDLGATSDQVLQDGIADTLMVEIVNFSNTIEVNMYAFVKSTDWEDNRRVTQEVLIRAHHIADECNLEFSPDYQVQLLN